MVSGISIWPACIPSANLRIVRHSLCEDQEEEEGTVIFKDSRQPQVTMERLMTQNVAGAMLNVNHAFTSIQPRLPRRSGSNGSGRLDLSIIGIGTQYPDNGLDSSVLETLAKRHYPATAA